MNSIAEDKGTSLPERLSLRERKKAKTRAAIQKQALKLFRKQGYAATTIEQIAEAAEVSPSTFFRYFRTKEDVVFWDEFDPLIIASFQAQPPAVSPVTALRAAMRGVFGALSEEEIAELKQRLALILSVREVQMAWLLQLNDAIRLLAEEIAKRLLRPTDDFAVRNLAGAVVGVMMSALLAAAEDPKSDMVVVMDDALSHLEAGLPL